MRAGQGRAREKGCAPELPEEREELALLLDEVEREGADDHLDDAVRGPRRAAAAAVRAVDAPEARRLAVERVHGRGRGRAGDDARVPARRADGPSPPARSRRTRPLRPSRSHHDRGRRAATPSPDRRCGARAPEGCRRRRSPSGSRCRSRRRRRHRPSPIESTAGRGPSHTRSRRRPRRPSRTGRRSRRAARAAPRASPRAAARIRSCHRRESRAPTPSGAPRPCQARARAADRHGLWPGLHRRPHWQAGSRRAARAGRARQTRQRQDGNCRPEARGWHRRARRTGGSPGKTLRDRPTARRNGRPTGHRRRTRTCGQAARRSPRR